jgi:hypothetical protein
VADVLRPVTQAFAPVVGPLAPVVVSLRPVVDAVAPVVQPLAPVARMLAPVIAPVIETLRPVAPGSSATVALPTPSRAVAPAAVTGGARGPGGAVLAATTMAAPGHPTPVGRGGGAGAAPRPRAPLVHLQPVPVTTGDSAAGTTAMTANRSSGATLADVSPTRRPTAATTGLPAAAAARAFSLLPDVGRAVPASVAATAPASADGAGRSSPMTPSAPGGAGAGVAAGVGGFGGGWSGGPGLLLFALFAVALCAASRLVLAPAGFRPVVFVSLLERPG